MASKQNHVLIDAVLSSAAHYSKISNLPQFTSIHPKSKEKIIAINTGPLAYTSTKLGDNLTNNDEDRPTNCKRKLDVRYRLFGKHAR